MIFSKIVLTNELINTNAPGIEGERLTGRAGGVLRQEVAAYIYNVLDHVWLVVSSSCSNVTDLPASHHSYGS